jgi:preprotein translocase subunit YajC
MAILPLLLLPVLMYFLLIRPQQRKSAAQKAMIAAISEGDEVMTTSGIFGFITAMEGDKVWLEIAEGVEIRVIKGALAQRIDPPAVIDDAVPAPGEADAAPGDDA